MYVSMHVCVLHHIDCVGSELHIVVWLPIKPIKDGAVSQLLATN